MSEILSPEFSPSKRPLAEVIYGEPYERFYEHAYKALEKWIVGENYEEMRDKLTADDGPHGEVTLRERSIIFPQGVIDYENFDFDENEIPGTWQLTTDKRHLVLVHITPSNHLLLSHFDSRAAAGLFNRVTELDKLREELGLSVEEAVIPVASASPSILAGAEDAIVWVETDNKKLAAGLASLGCIIGLVYLVDVPRKAMEKIREKVKSSGRKGETEN